ncbi:hypothetical protein [Streptomyces sp. NBC_01236]|uniref:hypothetical protein n=1 Tax=Streptomyces sp. NBC_01236 TaxID=2903789 RepID=UPI002E0EDEE7|nr:hypothetical protein OG324_38285 [Streptomyces sp. NBC_01236]
MSHIHASDVVPGVTGPSPKAASVIANKVWQGLAFGRFVITREGPALAEIAQIVEQALVQAPLQPSPEENLEQAIWRLPAHSVGSGDLASDLDRYKADRAQFMELLTTDRRGA